MTATVTVLYPNTPGSRFDMDYYLTKHAEIVRKGFGQAGMTAMRVTQGLGGGEPGSHAEYQVIAELDFPDMETLHSALAAHVAEAGADIPNFTDVTPKFVIGQSLV
jgi:uncharacterized protein (TIGR02118 family)